MGVASVLLVAQVAAADPVQEQLRLMEQRMAAMEDRLQATSDELRTAQTTVDEQQSLLADSGLIEANDSGVRSGVGGFLDLVDVSGVVAASFNYRLHESDIDGDLVGGNSVFDYPNANTFQVDQVWLTLDKAPTEESRGGFHADFIAGTSALAQGSSNGLSGDGEPYLYSAYVSYLAPIGDGVQVDFGRLGSPLGAEVLQTNGNFFITLGNVFGLQPVTFTGISAATQVTDEIGVVFGVVNDVYSDTATATAQDKAYYGQVAYTGDTFGLNIGGIIGRDSGACSATADGDCQTSVVDVVLTADPTEDLSLWANFDWKHTSGSSTDVHGDAFGIALAGRLAVGETMGVSSRFEYVETEDTLVSSTPGTDDSEVISLTGTLDKTLAEGLVGKLELRWDTELGDASAGRFAGGRNDQLVAVAQMYYEF
jgi:hypothetical protein